MDIEVIRSDLQALRKLYGLIENDGYSLPNESSDNQLDHKARLLLRELLDAAAERVFKAHAETLAVRQGSFDTASSTKKEQFKEMPKLQPSSFVVNVSNNFGSSVLEKDLCLSNKPASQVVSSEQSRLKIFSSQPQAMKKRCRVCRRSREKLPKQLKSSGELKITDWGILNPEKSKGVLNQLHNLSFQFCQGNLLDKELMSCNKAIQTANLIETQRRIGSFEFQGNRSEIGHSACSSNKPAAGIAGSGAKQELSAVVVKKPEETDQISKEASAKIQQIESHIKDLQLAAKPANPLQIQQIESRIKDLQLAAKPANPLQIQNGAQYRWHDPTSSSGPGTKRQKKRHLTTKNEQFREIKMPTQAISMTPKRLPPIGAVLSQNVGRNKRNAFEYDRLNEIRIPTEGYKLPSQKESQVPGKIVKAIVDRVESLSDVRSQDDHMSTQTNMFVQGLWVPPNWNKMATTNLLPLPAKLQSSLDSEIFAQSQTGIKKTIGGVGTSQPSWPSVGSTFLMQHNNKLRADDAGSELSRTRTKGETRNPHRKITRQNLPEHKPTQHRVSPSLYNDYWEKDQGSARKKNNQVGPRRLILPSQEVSQSTSSRSHYTSSWTSEQVSNSFSDDEEYSMSGATLGPSTSNESEPHSRKGRTVVHKVSSRSDSETYSVSSRTRRHQWDSNTSSESQDYLSSDQTSVSRHISPSDQSLGSTSRRRNPAKSQRLVKKQQIGRLKKLKDKLAIIFHHHHHHHHHHHKDQDDDKNNRHVERRGGKSLWKHAGRIFEGRRKEEAYGEQAVKKTRKPATADKNQRGHFQTLVEGLLQHLRHTKKSKPPKGGIGRPGNGGKKAVNKLHWWQILRRQRGEKMPKKAPRGKLGMGKKNPNLKALPKPR